MRPLVILNLILVSAVTAAQFADPSSIPIKPLSFEMIEPQISKLDNGCELWILEDHKLPLVQISLVLAAGSNADRASQTGLAELTARALIRGGTASKSPEQLDAELDAQAIFLDAYCDLAETQVSVSCLLPDLPGAVAILTELLINPGFEAGRIELAKQTILDIVARNQMSPFYETFHGFDQLVYGASHPVARVPSSESLTPLTREDLLAFHRTYYSPTGATLAIVGDVDTAKLPEILQPFTSSWTAREVVKPTVPEPQSAAKGQTVYVLDREGNQSTVLLGHLTTPPYSAAHYGLEIFNRIFGEGMSSRLFAEVRTKKGYAYQVGGGFWEQLPLGSFRVYSQTMTANVHEVVTTILGIINELRTTDIPEKEFTTAVAGIENSFVFEFATPRAIVWKRLTKKLFGYPDTYLSTYLDEIRKQSPKKVREAIAHSLEPANLILVLSGPYEELRAELEPLSWPIIKLEN